MKFRYITAYAAEGLQRPASDSLLLFSDAVQEKSVFLAGPSHDSLNHITTVQAIGGLVLRMLFQGANIAEFESSLSAAQADRIERYKNSALLVLEASHEEDSASVGEIIQPPDRNFCLSIANGFMDKVSARHKPFLDRSKAFLSFAMPRVTGLETIGGCIVADHLSGKPVYVLTFSANGTLTASNPIPESRPERIDTLFKHSDELKEFETPLRLFADSVSSRRDNLRGFLFAFTALDSFLSKSFRKLADKLPQPSEEDLSPKIHEYVEKIRKRREETGRTEDDYPLGYKFALIASYLDINNLDHLIDEFDHAQKNRNAIAHGLDFDEAALPTAKARNLLGELVLRFLEKGNLSMSSLAF